MSDDNRERYAEVREILLNAVRTDLIGPIKEDEALKERPSSSYITGILYPSDTKMSEEDAFSEEDFDERDFKGDTENTASSSMEDDKPDDIVKNAAVKPSSAGISFYISKDVSKLSVNVSWGQYYKDDIIEEGADNKEKHVTVWQREPYSEEVIIDLSDRRRMDKIYLHSDWCVYIYYVSMELKSGYEMVTIYLHNQASSGNSDDETEHTLFQVELSVRGLEGEAIFVPEYVCRNSEIEDEYYYKSRPVYARGRGCAASWKNENDMPNALDVHTAFIPEYELTDVSKSIAGIERGTFSMQKMGIPRYKDQTITSLEKLAGMYETWIKAELIDRSLQDDSLTKEQWTIVIQKCRDAEERLKAGVSLLKTDEKAMEAFLFMNQAMYLQRSITSYSKKYGNDEIPCSLSDFTKDDHSEWFPFQIAFILLNLASIARPESDDREIVDLLYFPTGGGKTEAYLGLIAFTVGYRRLSALESLSYEKDGGVTAFLRYTLRLLTTQQRDRLTKLVIAMEIIRERSAREGRYKFGRTRISIGFWVGGNVTPNHFADFTKDEYQKKDFMRKLTKQIIRCPYCGKQIEQSNYFVIPKSCTVRIHCSDPNCYFSEEAEQKNGTDRSIPVYLVDEEIYHRCPTVIISTVDKFAQLPWREEIGTLFGKTDRYCQRCGYIAMGEEHPNTHKVDNDYGLPTAHLEKCRPFYPPELIIQDELHLITGPLGTIYGGYETVIDELCTAEVNGKKIPPKYVVSTATIRNAKEQVHCLYARDKYAQFPPAGVDSSDSFFMKEISLSERPFRKYAGICASGRTVKTTLIRLYSVLLQKAYELSIDPKYAAYIDPYYTLIGYFNSIRELGGAVRLIEDDINGGQLDVLKKKYGSLKRRYLNGYNRKEITSRIPSWEIASVLEQLQTSFEPGNVKQSCYDIVIATNMIAVGMDVDRLGLMAVTGMPKQNSEYIQSTSRVGRKYPGLIFTVYNPYRPRDLSNYENFTGFHSQMYRYVEGTTATPFAARARDRFLHALVVSLIRLQYEKTGPNNGAANINMLSDDEINRVKQQILERVKVVSPDALSDTENEMNRFIDNWKARSESLYYYVVNTDKMKRLLNYYGQPSNGTDIPTLNSMRDVEQSSTVYYYQ